MKISIFTIDLFNIRKIKDINIYESLKIFFDNNLPFQDSSQNEKKHSHKDEQHSSKVTFEDFMEKNGAWLQPQTCEEL